MPREVSSLSNVEFINPPLPPLSPVVQVPPLPSPRPLSPVPTVVWVPPPPPPPPSPVEISIAQESPVSEPIQSPPPKRRRPPAQRNSTEPSPGPDAVSTPGPKKKKKITPREASPVFQYTYNPVLTLTEEIAFDIQTVLPPPPMPISFTTGPIYDDALTELDMVEPMNPSTIRSILNGDI